MHIEMHGPTDKDRLNRLGLEPVIARRVRVTLLLVDICNMNIQGPFSDFYSRMLLGAGQYPKPYCKRSMTIVRSPSSTLKPLLRSGFHYKTMVPLHKHPKTTIDEFGVPWVLWTRGASQPVLSGAELAMSSLGSI